MFFKKILIYFLVPILLIFFGILVPIVLNSHSALTVVVVNYNKEVFTPFKSGEIHEKEIVNGEFFSKENNLGIVAIRFNTFHRINDDVIIFKIKEKGKSGWYYSGKYKVDQFQPDDFFTFGFPIINDSKGKSYFFEIESTQGKYFNAVAISDIEPNFQAKYQFSRAELFRDKFKIFELIYKKIFYSFTDPSFIFSSFPFFLPLLFYLASLRYFKIIFKNRFPLYLYTFSLIIFTYLLFPFLFSNVTSLFLILFWIFLVYVNKFDSSVSFLYSVFSLVISLFTYLLKQELIADNFAIWTFFFLVIGTVQSIVLKNNKVYHIKYKDIIKAFIGEKKYNLLLSLIERF